MMAAMASTIAAVLWDFDGTIAETESVWRAAEQDLLVSLGVTDTAGLSNQFHGMSLPAAADLMRSVSGRTDLSATELTEVLVADVLDRLSAEEPRWQPGARELLGVLNAATIPCALVSASPRVLLDAFLQHLPVDTFATVVAGDEVVCGKPHPEPYRTAAAQLGVATANCLVIEDSPPGADSGNAAGAVVLAVPDLVSIPPAARRVFVDSLVGVDLEVLNKLHLAGTAVGFG